MRPELLSALGKASLSAGVMILAVLILRVRFQERTPRRAFCLLWDMILIRLLVLAEIPSPVSIRRLVASAAVQPAAVSAPPVVTGLSEGTAVVREAYISAVTMVQDAPPAVLPEILALPSMDLGLVLTVSWLAAVLLLAGASCGAIFAAGWSTLRRCPAGTGSSWTGWRSTACAVRCRPGPATVSPRR